MKRRSPGEWYPLPLVRNSRHCPRVRARAMAAFDYLIDSEYSGGPSGQRRERGGGGGVSLCLTSCRYPPMARGGQGVVTIVFVASTCRACVRACVRTYVRGPDLRGKGTDACKSRDNSPRKRRVTRINGRSTPLYIFSSRFDPPNFFPPLLFEFFDFFFLFEK